MEFDGVVRFDVKCSRCGDGEDGGGNGLERGGRGEDGCVGERKTGDDREERKRVEKREGEKTYLHVWTS